MKYVLSKSLFESRGLKGRLASLLERWVMGNEDYLRFGEEQASALISLIEENPFIREESLKFLDRKGVKTLWRGLHEDWDPEWKDGVQNKIASFSSDKSIASSFGGHTLLSVPVERIKPGLLLSVEWAAGWLDLERPTPEEARRVETDWGVEDDDLSFRHMAWSQAEFLVRLPLPQSMKKRSIEPNYSFAELYTQDGTRIGLTLYGGKTPHILSYVMAKNPKYGQGSKEPMFLGLDRTFPAGTSDEEILGWWEDRLAQLAAGTP